MRTLGIILLLSCATLQASAQSEDEKAIMQADSDFAKAAQTKKADAWADFATEDVSMPGLKLTSREQVRQYYAKFYADGKMNINWTPDYAKVFGDIGTTSGKFEFQNSGKTMFTGRYVTVWTRQPDGTWKYAWDSGTPDKPSK